MNKIISAEFLSKNVKKFEIEAPLIAKKRKPGQFIILRAVENGERIPLTISDANIQNGTISLIVQGVGKTTNLLLQLEAGDNIIDLVGPLGRPTHIEYFGNCVVIGGGLGTAIAYPTAKALKESNNNVTVIIGGRSADYIILENEMSEFADAVFITTDDGSAGMQGLVTNKLKQIIEAQQIDFVLAIGPIPMMEAVANLTREHGIKTIVSLNPIMLDGTGMCGGCRAVVDNKNIFVCVDGPEFDAHKVDFSVLTQRNKIYRTQEHISQCNLEKQIKEIEELEADENKNTKREN